MAIRLHDRVSGREAILPTEPGVFGRWLLKDGPESGLFLNSFKCVGREYLVPDASGRWALISENGARQSHGVMDQKQVLDELEVASIRSLGQRLEELGNAGAPLPQWLEVSPLVPGMSQRAEVLPLEQFIEQECGHLEEVCHKPRAHLLVDIERTPVSQARRIPHQAASYLASHTEDWERPTLRAVLPKRILAIVRDDEWGIYENRVAVRLVDHLLTYCARRIHELRRLQRVFEEAANYSRDATGGSYRRQHRVFELWGAAVDANQGLARATKTLKVVDGLRLRLSGLKDTALYRAVPRGAQVGGSLRITNILANDQHYRRVAKLWQEWARLDQARKPSPLAVHRERQEVCRGFARYCFLLVVRALAQMRYPLVSSHAPIGPSSRIRFDEPYGEYELVWSTDDTFELRRKGDVVLRLVPIASALGGMSEEDLLHVLSDCAGGAETHSQRVILIPGPASAGALRHLSEKTSKRLFALPQDGVNEGAASCGVLQVSPWDLGSVERVGRALRWALDGTRFGAYPFTLKAVPSTDIDVGPASGWLRPSGGDAFEISVPPSDKQLRVLRVDALVKQVESECLRLEREHGEVADALRDKTRRGSSVGDLNARKRSVSAALKAAHSKQERLRDFKISLERCARLANALLECPVCGAQSDAGRDFNGEGGRRFQCICPSCSAIWGTRPCVACSGWFPILLPKCEAPEGQGQWGWVDRALGCDVLSIPVSVGIGAQFVCPYCAKVS
jgi:hypothetical protein